MAKKENVPDGRSETDILADKILAQLEDPDIKNAALMRLGQDHEKKRKEKRTFFGGNRLSMVLVWMILLGSMCFFLWVVKIFAVFFV